MTNLRLAFMGTSEFAVPTLSGLIAAGHDVAAVFTQPPRPAGRGRNVKKTPVHQVADNFGLEVRHPASLRESAEQDAFTALGLDVAIVAAYGLLLPKSILDAPRLGCLNVHASLLPRWRGAAPIQRAIMAGDTETGISIMQMDEGLDTGGIVLAERIPITEDATVVSLRDELALLGADLLLRALTALSCGTLKVTPQDHARATYANKIDKGETRIDWARPASELNCLIRGLSPQPGAWFELASGSKSVRVKVLHARTVDGKGNPGTVLDDALTIACGEDALALISLQREGKKILSAPEFLCGLALPAGTELG